MRGCWLNTLKHVSVALFSQLISHENLLPIVLVCKPLVRILWILWLIFYTIGLALHTTLHITEIYTHMPEMKCPVSIMKIYFAIVWPNGCMFRAEMIREGSDTIYLDMPATIQQPYIQAITWTRNISLQLETEFSLDLIAHFFMYKII